MMAKREILLLSGVALAAGVLLYDRLAPSLQKNKDLAEKSILDAQAFVEEQKQTLLQVELKPHEQLMIRMLLEDSPPNPFARQWSRTISDQKNINRLSSVEPVLSYEGYIRCGERIIALVNGEEYEVGDKIAHVPLSIRKITPEQIDVENPKTISQSRLSIQILPLDADE
jgi:hypothetical protein